QSSRAARAPSGFKAAGGAQQRVPHQPSAAWAPARPIASDQVTRSVFRSRSGCLWVTAPSRSCRPELHPARGAALG
ncbi:hypothetical protein HPP92_014378, partial [Vanilla planifolia]